MKDSEKLNEWIDRYRSGDLKGEELSRFLLILKNDPLLQRELIIDRDLDILISREDLIEISEKIGMARENQKHSGFGIMPLLIAASLLILVCIGLILIRGGDSRQKGSETHASAPSYKRETGPYAAVSFVPLYEFEMLVGMVARGPSCKIIQPASRICEKTGSEILFEWTGPGSQETVSIELFDNRGRGVFSSGSITGGHFKLPTGRLVPGLYYWKVIIGEELITMGRVLLW